MELNEAFAAADDRPHVSRFAQIAQFGDALMMAGFRDPVLDRDLFTLTYDDLPSLMRELRAMGATNARVDRRHTLTGRGRFATAAAAYEPMRRADGKLPSSWEVIYAHAWAPDPARRSAKAGMTSPRCRCRRFRSAANRPDRLVVPAAGRQPHDSMVGICRPAAGTTKCHAIRESLR